MFTRIHICICNFKATAHSQKLITFKIKSLVVWKAVCAMLEAESSHCTGQTLTEYLLCALFGGGDSGMVARGYKTDMISLIKFNRGPTGRPPSPVPYAKTVGQLETVLLSKRKPRLRSQREVRHSSNFLLYVLPLGNHFYHNRSNKKTGDGKDGSLKAQPVPR